MIAGLLLFLILPLAVGGTVYATRRWATLSCLLAVGTSLALAAVIVVIPLGRTVELWGREIVMGGTWSLLGRELVLEDVDRIAIAFLYLTAAGIFALAWQLSPRSMIFPVGFGLLSLLSGSLLIRPLIYAVLMVEVAIALSVFALQPEDQGPTRGGLQYLSFSLLALPGLLLIHWLMGRYSLTPENIGLLDTAAILLALSFALLMGSVPFHTWIPSVASDSDPLAGVFVLTVNNGAVWFLLLTFLEIYPDFSAHPHFASLASAAGVAMVVVGGLLGAAQRRAGRLVGYSALVDSGAALIALGMNSERGLELALLVLMVRPFGLVLMGAGVKGLRSLSGGDGSSETLRGLARKAPWSTVAFLMGGLSMAGMPVTAGFGGRWPLYRALARSDLDSVLLMVLASSGLMIGMWRVFSALVDRSHLTDDESGETEPDGVSDGWLLAGLVAVAILASMGVGLLPLVVAPTAARLAGLYTFLSP